jgi:hypothetical protein
VKMSEYLHSSEESGELHSLKDPVERREVSNCRTQERKLKAMSGARTQLTGQLEIGTKCWINGSKKL